MRRLSVAARVLTVAATVVTSLAVLPAPATAAPNGDPSWELRPTGSTVRLRGLAPVNRDVAWVSGSRGTVLRTVDGGLTWQDVSPPGTADLQFRDIEAFDADSAVALSIGPGESSRVYVTDDGGANWTESFRNADPNAFYDCMSFWDRNRGLALSDPVDGAFRVLATADGGRSWQVLPTAGMPAALPGEFAFAASGTCLVTAGGQDAWIATGGVDPARVFHSDDGGLTWDVAATPVRGGPTAGIYSLDFRTPREGIAVGGDFTVPDQGVRAAAASRDGGRSWAPAADPGGYRSGVAWLPAQFFGVRAAIAVGPTGSDLTTDRGESWRTFDTGTFDAVRCTRDGSCWASGAAGRVAVLSHRGPARR